MKVNDIIKLGNYPQTKYSDELSPIEWRVLSVEDGKALVISEKILDMVRFNEKYQEITWEGSILRKWLNDDFYNKAFSDEEKSHILQSHIHTEDSKKWGTKGGADTEDMLFALSVEELDKYFPDVASRKAAATGKALEDGVYVYSETGYSVWWLRSPGYVQYAACRVNTGGTVSDMIYDDVRAHRGARPVMWIKNDRD